MSVQDEPDEAADVDDETGDVVTVPEAVSTKKDATADILTIMTDRCSVKFRHKDGDTEIKAGRWCNPCK
jgi:hypothetical protein